MSNVKIVQGIHEGNWHDPQWKLYEGTGPRLNEFTVPFGHTFQEVPVVHASIMGMEVLKEGNHRYNVQVLEVNKDSFRIMYKTWGDTKVCFIKAAWLAIGPE